MGKMYQILGIFQFTVPRKFYANLSTHTFCLSVIDIYCKTQTKMILYRDTDENSTLKYNNIQLQLMYSHASVNPNLAEHLLK